MPHSGVDHDEDEIGEIGWYQSDFAAADVEVDEPIGLGEERRDLIHQARLGAGFGVLGRLAGQCQRQLRQAAAREIVDRHGYRAGERCARRQPGADRHIRVDHDVGSHRLLARHTRVPQRTQHPAWICEPALRLALARPRIDPAVLTQPDGGDDLTIDREGQHEPVVVVGVLADEVHPPRRAPDAIRLPAGALPKGPGDAVDALSRQHGAPARTARSPSRRSLFACRRLCRLIVRRATRKTLWDRAKSPSLRVWLGSRDRGTIFDVSVVTCMWCGQLFAASHDLRWHLRHDHHLDVPAIHTQGAEQSAEREPDSLSVILSTGDEIHPVAHPRANRVTDVTGDVRRHGRVERKGHERLAARRLASADLGAGDVDPSLTK